MKQKTKLAQQQIKAFPALSKIKMIHQIDSIYQGCINNSYQKQGFGIQQTSDFQTYLGFWKNNKADGIGLIIYPNGPIIYGNFYRDQVNGIAITDDRKMLRIELVGVGFQYEYEMKTWRMSRYLKGLPIQIIKQETDVRQGVIPKIINIEQSLYNHLNNYIYKKFFLDQDIDSMFYHQVSPITKFFGFYDEGMYRGLGVVLQRNFIKQVGTFEDGKLTGYGLRNDIELSYTQIGFYNKGRKEGLFFERSNGGEKYVDYKRGNVYSDNLNLNMDALKKKQKKHNYQCKDFLSRKTSLPYQQIQLRAYQMRKKLQSEDQKEYQQLTKNYSRNINLKMVQASSKSKPKRASSPKHSITYFNAQSSKPKSSIQSIRQKMMMFSEVIDDYIHKSPKKMSPKKAIKWDDQNLVKSTGKEKRSVEQPFHMEQYASNDEIAEQENPFINKQSNWNLKGRF